jgi:hypothetical protein
MLSFTRKQNPWDEGACKRNTKTEGGKGLRSEKASRLASSGVECDSEFPAGFHHGPLSRAIAAQRWLSLIRSSQVGRSRSSGPFPV